MTFASPWFLLGCGGAALLALLLVVAGLRATDYQGWVILELGCPNEPLAAYFRRAQSQFLQLLV